jgi:DNA-binding NarL/FixJ family response regulator
VRDKSSSQSRGPVRVVIADSTRMGCQLLSDALRRDSRIKVVCAACDAREILNTLPAASPHVALISTNFGGSASAANQFSRDMHTVVPALQVVMLVEEFDRQHIVEGFRAGVRGIVGRTESIETLCKCIHVVAAGQIWANNEAMHFLLEYLSEPAPFRLVDANHMPLLSRRESEVVRWVAEGLTNREIAEKLAISEHTVKNYLFRIFDKLGVSSRIEVILYAFGQINQPQRASFSEVDAEPQSQEETFRCLLRAAEHSCDAQLRVAQMLLEGRGVTRDRVAALKWSLAAERGGAEVQKQSRLLQEQLKMQMPVQEIAAAQTQAEQWIEVHRHPNTASSHSIGPRSTAASTAA